MSKIEENKEKGAIPDWLSENEKRQRPLVVQALGEQVINLLIETGIANLRVGENGQISGQTSKLYVYPTTSYLNNIRLVVEDGKILIKAEVTGNSEKIGSVI